MPAGNVSENHTKNKVPKLDLEASGTSCSPPPEYCTSLSQARLQATENTIATIRDEVRLEGTLRTRPAPYPGPGLSLPQADLLSLGPFLGLTT
jgi:hypothetical protein